MEEEAAALAEEIGEAHLPAIPSGGQLLLPPLPILREDNWPLLTVSKGFFENLAQQRTHHSSLLMAPASLSTRGY
jgi:coatomer protein complex subunit alpha (xenin)